MERIGVAPGTEIGGYRVVSSLGQGGMGAVYRAVDGGGAPVALKLLHPHLGADPDARERLRREVAHLQRVRHPGVARVLDAEIESSEAFVVTELVDGPDLAAHVRRHGPMPDAELADLADQLREALTEVHGAGVLHRDLTPGNVLISPRGAVLIDFGIAQAAEDPRVTSAGMVVGTPGYLSPELLEGGEPGEAADWWGWAALLAFAATGRPPFGHRPVQSVLARAREGRPDLEGVPPRTVATLRAALAPDPAARLDPTEVVAELRRVAAGDLGDPSLLAAPAALAAGAAGATGVTTTVPPLGPDEGWPTEVHPTPLPEDDAPATAVLEHGSTRVMPAQQGTWDAEGTEPEGSWSEDGTWSGEGQWSEEDGWPQDGPEGAEDRWHPPGSVPPEGSPVLDPTVSTSPRRRVGSVLALGSVLVAVGATRPGVALAVALVLAVLVRSVGLDVSALLRRRAVRGTSRGAAVRGVMTWPWYLGRAVLGVLPSALLAAALTAMVGGVGWWLLGTGRLTVAEPAPGEPTGELAENAAWVTPALVGAVVVVALLMIWFGPMSRMTRLGARWTLAALAPGTAGAVTVVLLGLGTAAAVVFLVVLAPQGVPETVWWPLPGPPDLR